MKRKFKKKLKRAARSENEGCEGTKSICTTGEKTIKNRGNQILEHTHARKANKNDKMTIRQNRQIKFKKGR